MNKEDYVIHDEAITSRIFLIRGQKVMLDADLAELYGVETKRLKEQVRRNIDRFPEDFMFELTMEETLSLRSQFATLEKGRHSKYFPYAFTEHGILMLSGVLNSQQAVQVNIHIMRVFVKMKEMLTMHKDILLKLEQLEKNMFQRDDHLKKHEEEIQLIFKYLKELLSPADTERPLIGFKRREK